MNKPTFVQRLASSLLLSVDILIASFKQSVARNAISPWIWKKEMGVEEEIDKPCYRAPQYSG